MKNPYPLTAYLPEPLAQYGLRAPGAPAKPRPADYDGTSADSQIAGLGLLTALLVDDADQYRLHVTNMDLDQRDQLVALAEVASFVCRHQLVVGYLEHAHRPMQQAALLILFAVTAAHPGGEAPADRQLEAGRAIAALLEEQPYDQLLPALQEIAVTTCSPDQLERFGDAVANDETPLTY